MKNKKIIFRQTEKFVEGLLKKPNSAISYIPKWYKNQKLFSNEENNLLKAYKKGNFLYTYKLCLPVVDSLTAGYMVELPADVIVTNQSSDGYVPLLRWTVDFKVLDSQENITLGNYPIPTGYNNTFFRWRMFWHFKTPKDYSLWVTHPSHRHDLPFFTLNGFIDTDKHPNDLLLPFFIKDGFEGIIQAGTPIAQILPIKRENWKSFEEKYSEEKNINISNNVRINIIKTYKNRYWARKKYE